MGFGAQGNLNGDYSDIRDRQQRLSCSHPWFPSSSAQYNAQRYLGETLDTLLAQSFTEFELIVVDDGSTDRTADILGEYQNRDLRVRPIRIRHGGIVDAANAGIQNARAELIARADSDDLYPPDRLAKQVDFLETHRDCVAVGGRVEVIEPYGSPLRVTDQPLEHEQIEARLLKADGAALMQTTAMLRKSVAQKVGAYRNDYPWSEDLDLFLRMAEVGRLANLPDVLAQYRLHPGSTNWEKHDIQMRNKPRLIREAHERRGLTPPTELKFQSSWDTPAAERFTFWTWCALKHKNIRGARRHAMSALKLAPFSTSTWRAAYCA